jgi:hypothetical protein
MFVDAEEPQASGTAAAAARSRPANHRRTGCTAATYLVAIPRHEWNESATADRKSPLICKPRDLVPGDREVRHCLTVIPDDH